MLDKLVLDIETKNSFADVGGKQNLHLLQVSLIGAYSYKRDEYFAFEEKDFALFEKLLKETGAIIGFSIYNFDLPLISRLLNYDFSKHVILDILKEIEQKRGHRIGLNELAQANIGSGKNGNGLEAIELYKNQEIEKLKTYCLNDVKITKELYELILKQGYLIIPSHFHAPVKVPFEWSKMQEQMEEQLQKLEKEMQILHSQNSLF
ncbi:MAG: ribonuclease H-like domain-containing protein [Candidatus Pacebacteria bacterium]|nr:ribonuclease H-like domain-containing protein [Candidatus Paceibacterota bacterium]